LVFVSVFLVIKQAILGDCFQWYCSTVPFSHQPHNWLFVLFLVCSAQMPLPFLDADGFEALGQGLASYRSSRNYITKRRRFVSFFGIEPSLVSVVWTLVILSGRLASLQRIEPVHFLWALLFLQCYDTNERNAAMCGCDEKTFRKWSWFYLEAIADLDQDVVSLLAPVPCPFSLGA
jgi:hypothetical protein